jgi:hypothetical protein
MSSKYQNILSELDSSMKINKAYSKEPNWLISIKGGGGTVLTTSSDNVQTTRTSEHELANFAPIYDHQFSLTRGFAPESSSYAIMPDGGLTAHELKIVAPLSAIPSSVQEHFAQNVLLESIHLIRVITLAAASSSEANYHVAAEYMFTHAYIAGIVSNNDVICLAFRYAAINYTHNAFDPLTAEAKGKSAAAYHNLVTGAATPA